MGLTGLIGVIALLIFAVVFVVPILANIDDIASKGLICGAMGICIDDTPVEETERFKEEIEKQEAEAESRLPSTVGKTVCDLSIFTTADIVEKDFTIKISANESNPADYQWHCQFKNPLAFLGNYQLNNLLAFYAFDDEFVRAQVVLIPKENTGQKYDATHPDYTEMSRDIRLVQKSGFVNTPLNFDQTFYINDIVHDNYFLEIHYGRAINDMPAGDHLEDIVCMVENHPC